jgi:SAM-dependent methyltransferase
MPRRLNLPDSASVATPASDGKLFAPSAARNTEPLTKALSEFVPPQGRALEIASGTGQNVVSYAEAFPQVTWQPTEIAEDRIASIAAYLFEAGLPNVEAPLLLDATASGWAAESAPVDLILLSNLLHLISQTEAEVLISEAAKALAPGGCLAIYGPFSRDGVLVSDGDKEFDQSLRAQDSEIGYKSDVAIQAFGASCGLTPNKSIEMPANNLLLTWRAPS